MEEREVKLDVHPGFVVPPLDDVVGGASIVAAAPAELRATYWDTDDLRLARAGVTLRHRTEPNWSGWHVKLPASDPETDGIARLELPFDGGPSRPPEAVRAQVRPYTRRSTLQRVARLRTLRRTLDILAEDGAVLAEVCDDEVSVYTGSRLVSRFREIEVEHGAARDGEVADAIVRTLIGAGAERGPQVPKVVRALGPRATEPPDVSAPKLGKADPDRPVGEVVAAALQLDLERMIRHEPGTRRGDDPEELHQMRVATRRLRSTLRTFRPLLDRDWAEDLRRRLGSLAAALGEVRDFDVQLEAFAGDLEQLGADASGFLDALRVRREHARRRLLRSLDDVVHVDLLDDLVAAAQSPALLEPDTPAGDALAPLIAHAWRKVRQADADGAALHEIRIRIKRLRYAAEVAVPAFGKPAARLGRAAAEAQGVLGDHQDTVVAEDVARRHLAEGALSPDDAFVLGLLVGLARERRAAAEAQWPAAWKALRSRKLRRFVDV